MASNDPIDAATSHGIDLNYFAGEGDGSSRAPAELREMEGVSEENKIKRGSSLVADEMSERKQLIDEVHQIFEDVDGENRDEEVPMESEAGENGDIQPDDLEGEEEFDIQIDMNSTAELVDFDVFDGGDEIGDIPPEGFPLDCPSMDIMDGDVLLHDIDGKLLDLESMEEEEPEKLPKRRGRPPKVKKVEDLPEVNFHASYFLPMEEGENGFAVSELVWGKVRSHPWWPGQIFDPSAASELAMKHVKKDNFLVVYFGDNTFAWREESQLKHFYPNFSKLENQSNADSFVDAVNDALDEVSRRIELGMSCDCISEEALEDLKPQKIENAGIREGTLSHEVDRNLTMQLFKTNRFVDYLKELAQCPWGKVNRLELETAKAQMKAFYRTKGYLEIPRFYFGNVEDSCEVCHSGDVMADDDFEHHTNEVSSKNLSWLADVKVGEDTGMLENVHYESTSSGAQQNIASDDDSLGSHRAKRKRLDSLGDLDTKSLVSRQRHKKVGEGLRHAASLLTGSPSNVQLLEGEAQNGKLRTGRRNCRSIYARKDPEDVSRDWPSTSEMLSQLCLSASDSSMGYNVPPNVVSFISKFRESVFSTPAGEFGAQEHKHKRTNLVNSNSSSLGASTDNVQDSYWADIVFQNSSDESFSEGSERRKSRRGRPRKKNKTKKAVCSESEADHEVRDDLTDTASANPETEPDGSAGRGGEGLTPTTLVLIFNASDAIPAEADLVRIFSQFGPLKEDDTKITPSKNRVKVVFKNRSEAELALKNVSEEHGIFQSELLSFRLKYLH